VQKVCLQEVEPDGLVSDAAMSVPGERITAESEYEGIRLRFCGELGTARISMQIDVG
jgi:hypothetical protein